jgi:hypothetical protein
LAPWPSSLGLAVPFIDALWHPWGGVNVAVRAVRVVLGATSVLLRGVGVVGYAAHVVVGVPGGLFRASSVFVRGAGTVLGVDRVVIRVDRVVIRAASGVTRGAAVAGYAANIVARVGIVMVRVGIDAIGAIGTLVRADRDSFRSIESPPGVEKTF